LSEDTERKEVAMKIKTNFKSTNKIAVSQNCEIVRNPVVPINIKNA
tara:strand:+ start:456 stop:593 length:138 start_codon:yes stop_codon:yes gene_type:complete